MNELTYKLTLYFILVNAAAQMYPFGKAIFFEDFHSDKNVNQNNYEGGRGGKSIFR